MENRFHRVTPYAAGRLRALFILDVLRDVGRSLKKIRRENVSTSTAREKRSASQVKQSKANREEIFDRVLIETNLCLLRCDAIFERSERRWAGSTSQAASALKWLDDRRRVAAGWSAMRWTLGYEGHE
jgi:hypothetical protein